MTTILYGAKAYPLSELGREEEALEWFDRALAVKPDDYNSLCSKGIVLGKIGREQEACDLLERARDIAPDEPLAYLYLGYLADRAGRIEDAIKAYKEFIERANTRDARTLLPYVSFKLEELQKPGGTGSKVLNEILRALDPDKPGDFMNGIKRTRERLEVFTSPERSIPADFDSFFSVLRKWNSYTPVLPSTSGDNLGGGYFLFHNGKGIVIDPGFNFIENFYSQGFKVADIDAVIITHAHNDHTVDLEAILSLVYKLNKERREAESSDLRQPDKKIDLLVNAGTFMKYSGWLSLRTEDNSTNYVSSITVMHAGHTYEYGGLKIHAVKAKHHEIVSSEYCIGCIIEATGENPFKFGLTSDTGWAHDGSISKPYIEHAPDMMVIHIGSIKEKEFKYNQAETKDAKNKCYDEYHLGILGTTNLLLDTKPKLALISEFGEELKEVRRQIAEALEKVLNSEGVELKCLPSDIGLHIRLRDLGVLCFVAKEFVPYTNVICRKPKKGQYDLTYHCKHYADDTYDTYDDAVDRLSSWQRSPIKDKLAK